MLVNTERHGRAEELAVETTGGPFDLSRTVGRFADVHPGRPDTGGIDPAGLAGGPAVDRTADVHGGVERVGAAPGSPGRAIRRHG